MKSNYIREYTGWWKLEECMGWLNWNGESDCIDTNKERLRDKIKKLAEENCPEGKKALWMVLDPACRIVYSGEINKEVNHVR